MNENWYTLLIASQVEATPETMYFKDFTRKSLEAKIPEMRNKNEVNSNLNIQELFIHGCGEKVMIIFIK